MRLFSPSIFNFNSRPSARGDAESRRRRCGRSGYFNSRPSARGDAPLTALRAGWTRFQFTPLREGRRMTAGVSLKRTVLFQFTPLREGRRRNQPRMKTCRLISIHAPPRGATLDRRQNAAAFVEFQFTPLREGRRNGDPQPAASRLYFNSRPSARGDAAKDMQFLQIFCSTLTNQHGLTIMPRNLSRLFW